LGLAIALFMSVMAFVTRLPADDPKRQVSKLTEVATGVGPPNRRGEIWRTLLLISLFSVLAGAAIWLPGRFAGNLQDNPRLISHMRFLWVLPLILGFMAALMRLARRSGLDRISKCFARGDYEGALAQVDTLLRRHPQAASYHLMHGTILFFAGKLAEAEQALRTSLEKLQVRLSRNRERNELDPVILVAIALERLGSVLIAQCRFQEATAALDSSAKSAPRFAEPYSLLAEVCLRQNRDPQRALQLLDQGFQQHRLRTDPTLNIGRYNLTTSPTCGPLGPKPWRCWEGRTRPPQV
jgi:tetratricopeptide (TPR) repeat protein